MNGKTMKGIVASLAGMLVMACSGCGGGGGGSSPSTATTPAPASAPAPASTPAVKKTITLEGQGDSTMWGAVGMMLYTMGQDLGIPYVNDGIGFATIRDSLTAPNIRYSTTFDERIAKGDIILENYGINDVRNYDVASFANDLRTWVNRVRAAGKVPVIEQPNPICLDFQPGAIAGVAANAQAAREVANEMNVLLIDQFDWISAMPNWQSKLADCVHPTIEMYQMKGHHEADILRPLVEAMQKQ